MDELTRQRLNAINRRFYQVTAGEFDATRQVAWQGWRQLLSLIDLPLTSVFDVGCGNGRFAAFIADNQTSSFVYHAVDNNADLLASAASQLAPSRQIQTEFLEHDLILNGLPRRRAQLVVLFGLLHHVPGLAQRQQLIAAAAQTVMPGGWLAFTAWRFYDEERFRQRIVPWCDDLNLEAGDHLLDWRRGERALRYCHFIDDDEHEQLLKATGLTAVADYRADGATGTLNRYSVLVER